MTELQLRLQEAEESVMMGAAAELTPEERKCIYLRQLEAKIKVLEEERDAIKKEVLADVLDGLVIGGEAAGGQYEVTTTKREAFDAKAAMEAGLINKAGEWAGYWKTSETKPFLVFKPYKKEGA